MEIKKEHIKPNLLKLLEENNCVEAFLENANNNKPDFVEFCERDDFKFGQLGMAFNWFDTKQGANFWIRINKQLPND